MTSHQYDEPSVDQSITFCNEIGATAHPRWRAAPLFRTLHYETEWSFGSLFLSQASFAQTFHVQLLHPFVRENALPEPGL